MSAPLCDAGDCSRDAVVSLMFRGQLGHVHVCASCEAVDREWCDVTRSASLPCPWGGCDVLLHTSAPTDLGP